MKNVKSIQLKYEIQGNGIVNFDSSEQRFTINKLLNRGFEHLNTLTSRYDNVQYAKKTISETGYKIKISSDCQKKALFPDSAVPSIQLMDQLLYSYMATPDAILKGHFFVETAERLKRKGALTITDAIQISNDTSQLETFSRSGEKKEFSIDNSDETNLRGDTTFFKKETIGNITYEANGEIDLEKLQFISCDPLFDRFSFNPDKFSILKKYLQQNFKNFDSELGYFHHTTSSNPMGENGFMFKNDHILYLVKHFLRKLLSLRILRRDAKAVISKLSIRLISDPISDNLTNDNWIEIKTNSDIDNLLFEVEQFYTPVIDDALELRNEMRQLQESNLTRVFAKKQEKLQTKKDAKEKHKVKLA